MSSWVALDKGLVVSLKKIRREFSEVEAMFSLSLDVNCNKVRSLRSYSRMWSWSIGKVKRFIERVDLGGTATEQQRNSNGTPYHVILLGNQDKAEQQRNSNGTATEHKYKEQEQEQETDIVDTASANREIYKKSAQFLADIVTSQKNINITKQKITKWADSVRLLVEVDGISLERLKKALTWYKVNVGGDYVPVIEAGKTLRSKFLKLEGAINRSTKNGEASGDMDKDDAKKLKELNTILAQKESAPSALLDKYATGYQDLSYQHMFERLGVLKSQLLSKY